MGSHCPPRGGVQANQCLSSGVKELKILITIVTDVNSYKLLLVSLIPLSKPL